jgi:hypothetical protein
MRRRRDRSRVVALGIAAVLCVASMPVHASAPAPEVERARELFDQGARKYEVADYAGAIELWTRAYERLPVREDTAKTRQLLRRNIGQAHVRAYEVDRDATHLRQARALLQGYLDNVDPASVDDAALQADRERVQQMLETVDTELAQLEREWNETGTEAPTQTEPDATPPRPTSTSAAHDSETTPGPVDRDETDRDSTQTAMLAAGGVLAGVGIVGLSVMGWGLARGKDRQQAWESARDDAAAPGAMPDDTRALAPIEDAGQRANDIALGMGIAGGIVLATGVALIIVGVRRGRIRSDRTSRLLPHGGLRWQF